jgi:hypothetical protein
MTGEEIELMRRLVQIADERFDGHLTILKFTTNWRVGFKTPTEREDIDAAPVGRSFAEAAQKALASIGEAGT